MMVEEEGGRGGAEYVHLRGRKSWEKEEEHLEELGHWARCF